MADTEILVAEDDPTIRMLLTEVLTSAGYKVTSCENGLEALQKFKEKLFPVAIIDIEMPMMSGGELIENIFLIAEETIVIVASAHSDLSTVIDVMKKGVYDYIVKPMNIQEFIIKIKRACEAAGLRKLKTIRDKEKVLRLENLISWYKYKEKSIGSIDTKDKSKFHKSLFDSLKTNFSQGAGFGTLVTLAEMISYATKNDSNQYLIDAEIIDLFLTNIKVTEKALGIFAEIDWIISNPLKMERKSLLDFYDLVCEVELEAQKYITIKNQRIVQSDSKPSFKNLYLEYNSDYMKKVVKELMMNAMKFSESNSSIVCILESKDGRMYFSVINKPLTDVKGNVGILEEYQNIIFEPFFRLWNYMFDEFETLDYGLGLTLAEKILLKHEGRVNVTNLLDHSDGQPETKVEFAFSIPTQ